MKRIHLSLLLILFQCSFLFAEEKLEKITSEIREKYLQQAQVWHPTDVAKMDIRTGPKTEISVPPDSQVTCEYVEPKEAGQVGAVPKFKCKRPDGETLRVKFGSPEVYGEIVAARLMWALGFYADDIYPVQILCKKCPEKNIAEPAADEKRIDRLIKDATIERNFPGVIIQESEDQGVTWLEVDKIDATKGGAPRAHIDALKLLAVFLQHADSKPDNQRLACLNEDLKDPDGDGFSSCSKPILMIQDPGATFGGGFDVLHVSKLSFVDWDGRPMWNIPKEAKFTTENATPICYGNLTASMKAKEEGLTDPVISEDGRQFLVDLLNQLTDEQILNLFRVARVDHSENFVEKDGVKRPVTVEDWAATFKKKRAELADHKCPVMVKP